jgi:hypothetical protein
VTVQTAQEIENALDAWLETSPVLHTYHHDGSRSTYSETITGRTELVYYLEDEAPLNVEGVRYLVIPGIDGEIILSETKGGEGEGDYAHAVISVGDRYFMLHGHHRSYDGTYYDGGFSEVKPVKKTIDAWDDV